MKTYLVAFVAVLVSIVACQANTPAPVTPVDDAGCTQAALEAKKCPPCTCGDAGTTPPVVVIDAGPVIVVTDAGDVYDQACAHLFAIECSAGKAKNCADRMRQVTGDRLVRGPDGKSWNHDETGTACLLKAKDSKTAEACGFVKCN